MRKFILNSGVIILYLLTFSIDLMYAQSGVGIGTSSPEAMLDVNGDVRIQDAKVSNLPMDILGIDEKGYVFRTQLNGGSGGSGGNEVKKLIFQNSEAMDVGFDINLGDVVIKWKNKDVLLNNIITFDAEDHTFEVNESGLYSFSCFVNYRPTVNIPLISADMKVSPNDFSTTAAVILQHYNNMRGRWEDFAGATQIWELSHLVEPKIIRLSSIYKKLQKEDKFRVVLRRVRGLINGYKYNGFWGVPLITNQDVAISRGLDVSLIKTL